MLRRWRLSFVGPPAKNPVHQRSAINTRDIFLSPLNIPQRFGLFFFLIEATLPYVAPLVADVQLAAGGKQSSSAGHYQSAFPRAICLMTVSDVFGYLQMALIWFLRHLHVIFACTAGDDFSAYFSKIARAVFSVRVCYSLSLPAILKPLKAQDDVEAGWRQVAET